ncbi:P-loop containing nucleoside triphosphate hydrolase protein [Aspergillus sclerotioniger CBS 115572]|uniref:Kinesin-like protein n=1 Tax=Aspergillus sclerotioniger CBS 115572 TaxID=1450535 RepID=A0A317VCN1_9EURO|nr:P-loop containing nucleoside triphosphate hydrolase protein [Aspergillus sclerotioniger CBS 115572]PWY69640.1 P-loop containing nucleoside triphosphate hydrolase protein [Aspergillus sclerotioniger CBS 115572]
MNQFRVITRWRPLASSDVHQTEINRNCEEHPNSRISMSLVPSAPNTRPWKSEAAFTQVFEARDNNKTVFDAVVAPTLPEVLKGHCSNFFAYGHSGSGKSHTIMGYDFNNPHEFGMCLAAGHHLFEKLEALNEADSDAALQLGIGLRMYELRNKTAFDLLNGRCNCHVREGYDGQTHIRGETEVLENGKVRVRPIVTKACWSFDELRRELLTGLALRATGSSTIHDQSSRTHAVLELEIVTRALLDARDAVIERQSELVPVAKRATDIYLEENLKGVVQTPDGEYIPSPDYQIDQARIDAAEAQKAEFETFVKEAEHHVEEIMTSSQHRCLGGKLVFVDLAGSEYYHDKAAPSIPRPKQTAQEQQEGRQINTDLLSLKEVIRAKAHKQTRIPFRSSPLTMVLRAHFMGSRTVKSHSAMILTVSPSAEQFAATMNTLKYGNLIGVAGSDKKAAR